MLFWQALNSPLRAGALGCLLASLAACAGDGAPPSWDVTLRALDQANQETTTFAQGAVIKFEMVVTNLGASPEVLVFDTTGIAYFWASGPGGLLAVPWASSWDWGYPKGPVTLQFAPGEVKKFTKAWDQRGSYGNPQVGPGDYSTHAKLLSQVGHISAPLLTIAILP